MARRPAVAGSFYEDDAKGLRDTMRKLLIPVDGPGFVGPVGVVAPHAAYEFSGAVAGRVYSSIEVPDRVVIITPNHTGLGLPASVSMDSPWITPLGPVEVDTAFGRRLTQHCAGIGADELAHLEEHGVEVQLPFIQSVNPGARIVPLCLRTMSFDLCVRLGQALAALLGPEDEATLLVASSDMNHHEPSKVATRKDRMALDRIEAMDAKGLYHVVVDHHVSMCGFVPVVVMLVAAKALGSKRSEMVSYANSGDVNHDYSSVVGYAGVVVSEGRQAGRTRHFSTL